MPVKDMAIATAAFGFMRSLAGSVGIAVGDVIYTTELRKRLHRIDGIESFINGRDFATVANDIKGLTKLLVRFGCHLMREDVEVLMLELSLDV